MRRAVTALILGLFAATAAQAGPWAAEVVSYDPGIGPAPVFGSSELYTNAHAALGPASTFTGEAPWAGPVTMFNAPYLPDQVVSVGSNGSLVVRFALPVSDRPGDDFIVYGNTGFVDPVWDDLTLDMGSPASLYGADGGTVEVSPDGVAWRPVAGEANGPFPTQPWTDAASTVPADFGKPMPGGLTLADFDGLTFAQALALYDGSAGGAGFDIADTGWSEVHYVRVSYHGMFNVEVDALRVVPEPATLALLGLGALGALRRRRP